jgi:hypothetical protein
VPPADQRCATGDADWLALGRCTALAGFSRSFVSAALVVRSCGGGAEGRSRGAIQRPLLRAATSALALSRIAAQVTSRRRRYLVLWSALLQRLDAHAAKRSAAALLILIE